MYVFQCCSLEIVFFKCVLESFDALISSGNAVVPEQGKILNWFCSFPLPLGTRFLLLTPSSHMVSEAPDSFPRTLVANRLFWWWGSMPSDSSSQRPFPPLLVFQAGVLLLPSALKAPDPSIWLSALSPPYCCCSVTKPCPILCDLLGCTPSLFSTISRSWLRFMSLESMTPSNRLIFCHCLLLLPSVFPSIRVLSQLFASDGQSIGPYSV